MASVENRVVSIKFDNGNFQQKVSSTIKAMGELTKSLALPGASKGLDDLDKAASNVDLSELEEAPKGISASFAAMATVGITALANLTNRAVDAGIGITKAFTLDLVGDGFAEYELKMGAIQTIMAGTGEDLDTVNGYLNDLNTYADRTIYSFADMTQNIGKFTNAGVSLETATDSIQGIANVAALAGSNSQQASNAMYNFSQALATGSVKLIDWKSIENAGLATVGFKEQLLEGAVAAGTLTKDSDGLFKTLEGVPVDTMKNFNTTLAKGWLSSEALTNTLTAYSDESTELGQAAAAAAQDVKTFSQMIDTVKEAIGSGWASTFELVVGDFEEGKALFTELEGAITGLMTAGINFRIEQLKLWKQFGGRERLINGLKNVLAGLGNILRPISEAFRDLFPRTTGTQMLKFTRTFESLSEKFKDFTAKYSDSIKSIFRGIFSIFKIGFTIVSSITKVFAGLFGLLVGGAGAGAGKKLIEFAASVGDFIYNLQQSGAVTRFFENAVKKVVGAITTLYDNVRALLGPIVDEVKNFMGALVDFVKGIEFDPVIEQFNKIKDAISDFFSALGGWGGGAKDVGSDVANTAKEIGAKALPLAKIGEAVATGLSYFTMALEKLSGAGDVAKGVVSAIGSVFSSVGNFLMGIFSKIGDAIGGLGGDLADKASGLDFGRVMDIIKVALGAGLVGVLASFAKNGFQFDFAGGLLEEAADAMEGVGDVLKGMSLNLKAEALLKLAAAIAVMGASMVLISLIPTENLIKGGAAMAGITANLVAMMLALDKLDFSAMDTVKLAGLAFAFMALSASMLLFGLAVGLIGTMDWDTIEKGLTGVTLGLLAMTTVFAMLEGKTEGMVKAAFAIGVLALSLGLFGVVLTAYGLIPWDVIQQGLLATTMAMIALSSTLSILTDKERQLFKAAASIGLLALSLVVFAGAVALMGSMDMETIGRGLVGITAGLATMVGSMYILNKLNLEKASMSLLFLSIGMRGIAKAVAIFSGMSWEELYKGLGSFMVILVGLYYFLEGAGTNLEKGAVGLLALGGAMLMMAVGMKAFGAMSWEEIGKGLAGIAGALAILVVVGYTMGPVIPVLTGLGVALALLGAAIFLAGVGILAFATAFQLFTTLTGDAVAGFMLFVDALITKLPELAYAAGRMVLQFAQGFLSGWPELIVIIGELFSSLLDLIIEYIPKIMEIISLLVSGLITLIEEKVPEFIVAAYTIILALIEGLESNLPAIIEAGIGILLALIEGIKQYVVDIGTAATDLIVEFILQIGNSAQVIIDAGIQVLVELIEGITKNIDDLLTAASDLILKLIEGVGDMATDVIDSGVDTLAEFVKGLGENITDLFDLGVDFITEVVAGAADATSDLVDEAFTIMVKFIDELAIVAEDRVPELMTSMTKLGIAIVDGVLKGLSDSAGLITTKLKNMAKDAIGGFFSNFGINSPAKTMIPIGVGIVEGVVLGLDNEEPSALKKVDDVSGNVLSAFQKSLQTIPTELEGMEEFNPTITPVLDLSEVAVGARGMNTMLNNSRVTANVQGNLSSANSISLEQSQVAQAILDATVAANEQPREVTYEQNIYSPTALSTVDIYRSTRNQIALAKEELSIR